MSVKSLVKPARWGWSPALITPEAKELTRDLILMVPFWENSEAPFDYVNRQTASLGTTPSWVIGPGGFGIDTRSVANRIVFSDIHKFATGEPVSVFLFGTFIQNGTYVSVGTDAFGYYVNLYVSAVGPDDWWWAGYGDNTTHWDKDGATVRVSASYAGTVGGEAVKIVSNGEVHTDGTTSQRSTDSDDIVIGSNQNDTTQTTGLYYCAYAWKRALTDAEHNLLARDPFILLRRNNAIPTVLAADTGQTITPALVTQSLTAVDPAITTGNVNLEPALVTQSLTAVDPSVSTVAGLEITPTLVTQTLTAVDPAITTGNVNLEPGLVTQTLTPVAPTVTSNYTLEPTLVTQSLTAVDPSVATGTAVVSPALVTQTLTPVEPSVSIGEAQAITPETLSQLITTLPPAWISGGVVIGREVGALFRIDTSNLTIVWGFNRGMGTGFRSTEGWAKASGNFQFTGTVEGRNKVMDDVRTVWLANKAAAIGDLQTALNAALTSAGYLSPTGGTISIPNSDVT